METFMMSRKEVPRAGLLKAALAGRITNAHGARALRLSVRQFRRLKKRFREGGARGLLHALRGRPGNRQLAPQARARVHVNFFQPVQKLVTKHRDGARVHRVYDRAQTPYQRLCASGVLSPTTRADLEALYQRLNPLRLRCTLDAELDRLWALAAPDPHRQGHTAISTPSSKSSLPGSQTMAPVTL